MKILLTKIEELSEAMHPNNIEKGFQKEGEFVMEPMVGSVFWIGSFRTSIVKEIIDKNTFKTCNSIYKWEEIK